LYIILLVVVSTCLLHLSKSPRFAKAAVTNLNDFLRRSFFLHLSRPACNLFQGCITMLSDSVATSPLALRWMCGSPRTGCVRRTTRIYVARTNK